MRLTSRGFETASGTAALALVLLLAAHPALAQGTVLVELGSGMSYLPNNSDPLIGIAWTAQVYPNTWATGTYGVGYGAGTLIQTTVDDPTRSVYTRAEFTLSDPGAVTNLFLHADWDDGYIAWINGLEVYRSPQMPDATTVPEPTWNTPTSSHESSNAAPPEYGPLIDVSAAIPLLEMGTNVLAVGVWNTSSTSSDLVVVPQLLMNVPAGMNRGPYLQKGTSDGMVIRWRTNTPELGRVRYGAAPDQLTTTVDEASPVQEHEVSLGGLSADTVYYYSVGNPDVIYAGGDVDHSFRTAPPVGTRMPVRVWVLGDSGTADSNAADVRDAYEAFTGSTPTDLWLMLGDNAYPHGTDAQYQAAVFDMYPDMLRTSALWPTLGNHDAVSSSSTSLTGPYYSSFTLPDDGSAGGISSGTEAYYSFDFANIHFICLDSHFTSLHPAMLTWLQADLLDTGQDWVVAFFHHPPYSKGSHDSDDPDDSGGRLFAMREQILPLLEAAGVDLVLTGHSHSYERSFLLDGHYGLSGEIVSDPSLKLDAGDGRVDGNGAYQKPTAGPAPHEGAVHMVAGSSGKISGGPLNHPAMFISWNEHGSVVLDVEGDRMDLTFLNRLGEIRDYLTLVKDTATAPAADFIASPASGPVPLSVQFTDASTTNTAAWDWDLDGDTFTDSTVRNPSRVYVAPGLYTVTLTASNDSGSAQETKVDHICASEGVPADASGLRVGLGGATLSWDPLPAADHYDVVKGDVGLLGSSGGDFSASMLGCLEDDGTDLEAVDPASPGLGQGFFYLVRGLSLCEEAGTYDSGGAGQAVSRDQGIQDSPVSCLQ